MNKITLSVAILTLAFAPAALAQVQFYGNENVLGTGTYSTDPTTGATLFGLAPGAVTYSSVVTPHGYPFTPGAGDFPGTDQIYVGSTQTGADDGYSVSAQRINGPDNLVLDYSALVPAGAEIDTLTLGIAADDFQFPVFGNPFVATINGSVDTALTNALDSLNESGPVVQFLTVGIDPATLASNHVLDLSIDEGGNGGDGWAVDFLTVGVTTSSIPETPSSLALLLIGLGAVAGAHRLLRRQLAVG